MAKQAQARPSPSWSSNRWWRNSKKTSQKPLWMRLSNLWWEFWRLWTIRWGFMRVPRSPLQRSSPRRWWENWTLSTAKYAAEQSTCCSSMRWDRQIWREHSSLSTICLMKPERRVWLSSVSPTLLSTSPSWTGCSPSKGSSKETKWNRFWPTTRRSTTKTEDRSRLVNYSVMLTSDTTSWSKTSNLTLKWVW